jgi:hypothetical protein
MSRPRWTSSNVEKAFKRVLKAAGLPLHHSPHSLRHTFASLLPQQGEAIQYVQRMLGHASITLTVDIYGKWLPMGKKAAVDRLGERRFINGGQNGGKNRGCLKRRPQDVDLIGDPGGLEPSTQRLRVRFIRNPIGSYEPPTDDEYEIKEGYGLQATQSSPS